MSKGEYTCWFVTYQTDQGDQAKRFYKIEDLWEWLQMYKSEADRLPKNLAVYKATDCWDLS